MLPLMPAPKSTKIFISSPDPRAGGWYWYARDSERRPVGALKIVPVPFADDEYTVSAAFLSANDPFDYRAARAKTDGRQRKRGHAKKLNSVQLKELKRQLQELYGQSVSFGYESRAAAMMRCFNESEGLDRGETKLESRWSWLRRSFGG